MSEMASCDAVTDSQPSTSRGNPKAKASSKVSEVLLDSDLSSFAEENVRTFYVTHYCSQSMAPFLLEVLRRFNPDDYYDPHNLYLLVHVIHITCTDSNVLTLNEVLPLFAFLAQHVHDVFEKCFYYDTFPYHRWS